MTISEKLVEYEAAVWLLEFRATGTFTLTLLHSHHILLSGSEQIRHIHLTTWLHPTPSHPPTLTITSATCLWKSCCPGATSALLSTSTIKSSSHTGWRDKSMSRTRWMVLDGASALYKFLFFIFWNIHIFDHRSLKKINNNKWLCAEVTVTPLHDLFLC